MMMMKMVMRRRRWYHLGQEKKRADASLWKTAVQAPKMGAHHGRGLEKKMTIYADDSDRLENNEDNYEYDEDNDDDDKGDEYIASS